jgi:hypothetical protein
MDTANMTAMTADVAVDRIRARADTIKSDAMHTYINAGDDQIGVVMEEGEAHRQGDLYIRKIGKVPAGAVRMETPRLQLAPGQTQGSRHVLDSAAGVEMFEPGSDATALDGPVLVLKERRIVTHPEHGDVSLPAGTYCIDYQRAFADELRAQRD